MALFAIAIIHPLPYGNGKHVSPLLTQPDNDIVIYEIEANRLFVQKDYQTVLDPQKAYQPPSNKFYYGLLTGPLFPFMLHAFDYSAAHTLPLSIMFLFLGIAFAWIWVGWLREFNLGLPWLLLFLLIPNPLWFSISVSSDLPFALLTGVFFTLYVRESEGARRAVALLIVALLACLTRPVGICLIWFWIVDMAISRRHLWSSRPFLNGLVIVPLAALLGIATYFYWGYLVLFVNLTLDRAYFGIPMRDFYHGLFKSLPAVLNYPFSWFLVICAKVLFFIGIRPVNDYFDPSFWNVFARSWSSYILFVGYIAIFLSKNRKAILLVAMFTLRILIGYGHDRYVFPILPLMYGYGATMIRTGGLWVWQNVRKRYRLRLEAD